MAVFLVTGSSGFLASRLIADLNVNGHQIVATTRGVSTGPIVKARSENEAEIIQYKCDLSDSSALYQIMHSHKPDYVVHLAGQSSPKLSWENPQQTMIDNYNKTTNLITALKRLEKECRLVFVSSSAVYADNQFTDPIPEDYLTEPSSPYGISKLAAEKFCMLGHKTGDIDVVVVRPFFVTGVGKVGDVCSDWCRQVAEIELGQRTHFQVGLIEGVSRDLMDASEFSKALNLIALKGKNGSIYNISTGKGLKLSNLLKLVSSFTNKKIDVVQDKRYTRKTSEKVRIGCSKKLQKLGWVNEKNLDETLYEMFVDAIRQLG